MTPRWIDADDLPELDKPTPPASAIRFNGDGTYTDTATGLNISQEEAHARTGFDNVEKSKGSQYIEDEFLVEGE